MEVGNGKSSEKRSSRAESRQAHKRRLRHLFTRTKQLQPTAETVQGGPSPTKEEAKPESARREKRQEETKHRDHTVFLKAIVSDDVLDL